MANRKALNSRRLALPFACSLLAAVLWGCNGDKSDPNGPPSSGDCQQLMSSYCNRVAACDPIGLRNQFGDVQTCLTRQMLACPNLTLTGTGWTAGKIQQCTAQISGATSCDDEIFEGGA